MVHLREQQRSTAGKKARSRKPSQKGLLLRNSAGKVTVRSGDESTQVAVSKTVLKQIGGKPQFIGKVLRTYADTVAKAKKTRRIVTVSFRVSPDGKTEPVVAKPDALDTAIAKAQERGQAKVAEILKGEDMVTARDFGRLIGASHETVNAKRRRFEILGLEAATRGVKYPRWQITETGMPLPGLPKLFSVLGEQPWTVYRFLRSSHAELGGRTALEALKAGQVDAVIGVARNQANGAFG